MILIVLFIAISLSACEDFLAVDLSDSKITSDLVFSTDITASSAVTGIYFDMLDMTSFASGSGRSVATLAGLSSDELMSYSSDRDILAFNQNELLPENIWVLGLWKSMYKTIYEANAVVEGLSKSTSVTAAVKNQLLGEAKFVRAFSYFYLVNLFGDVPLVTTTNYKDNASVSRIAISVVYDQIVNDLIDAQSLFPDEYVATDRSRPCKSAATALLARVYLYRADWAKAAEQASLVLGNNTYGLMGLDQVFTWDSQESIWQLKPVATNVNTLEGNFFILTASPVNHYLSSSCIYPGLLESFEPGDLRKDSWVGTYQDQGGKLWYFPFKYKVKVKMATEELSEYSVVLRLAEQYLIRAEARAQVGDISGAISDLDAIRSRAGLPLISDIDPGVSQDDLLLRIKQEKRIEFFSEWGHRWFDLKRENNIDGTLEPVKENWDATDTLYPIPQSERNKNPNLGNQNSGY